MKYTQKRTVLWTYESKRACGSLLPGIKATLALLFHKRHDYQAGLADSIIAYSSCNLFDENDLRKIFVGSCSSAVDSPEKRGALWIGNATLWWACLPFLFKVHFTANAGEDLPLREKTLGHTEKTAFCRSVIEKRVPFLKVSSFCSVCTRRECVFSLASFCHLKVF